MSFFKSFFEDKLIVDTRDPWLNGIEIPGVAGSFDVLAPLPDPWLQLAAVRSRGLHTSLTFCGKYKKDILTPAVSVS